MIRSSTQFVLVTPPSYALTVFRLCPKHLASTYLSLTALNDLNRLFYTRISARSDILLTQTQLNGVFCVRFAVGAVRTDEVHIERAFELLCEEALVATKTFEDES